MNHCVSKRLKAFLESFETRFANLILVFLETSGSPMDPEPHDWNSFQIFPPGTNLQGVSGSESNVDHDVRKPLVFAMPLGSQSWFRWIQLFLVKGSKVNASNTMQRKGLFSLGAPWNVHETNLSMVPRSWRTLSKRLRPGGLEPPTEGAVNLNSSN